MRLQFSDEIYLVCMFMVGIVEYFHGMQDKNTLKVDATLAR